MTEKRKHTLSEAAGIGSVEQHGHGAVTVNFMMERILDRAIRMVKRNSSITEGHAN